MRIYITSDIRAAVSIHFDERCFFGTDKTAFFIDDKALFHSMNDGCTQEKAIILLTPLSCYGKLPICAELSFEISECGVVLSAVSAASNLRIIDWHGARMHSESWADKERTNDDVLENEPVCEEVEEVFELIPEYSLVYERTEAKLIDRIDPVAGRSSAELSLYSDDGLRLIVRENGIEKGFILSSGNSGSLRTLEAGFEQLLLVHAKGCQFDSSQSGKRGEELIVLNSKYEMFGTISGESCFIENGLLTAINELGTVCGHQHRLRYELCPEGLRPLSSSAESASCYESQDFYASMPKFQDDAVGEIGFFTHPPRLPKNESEAALAMLEALLLGLEDETMAFLAPNLRRDLKFDNLCEFLGDFEEARIAPFSKKNGSAILGAVNGSNADAYLFEFENALISDISEFEEPLLLRCEKGLKGAEKADPILSEPE